MILRRIKEIFGVIGLLCLCFTLGLTFFWIETNIFGETLTAARIVVIFCDFWMFWMTSTIIWKTIKGWE